MLRRRVVCCCRVRTSGPDGVWCNVGRAAGVPLLLLLLAVCARVVRAEMSDAESVVRAFGARMCTNVEELLRSRKGDEKVRSRVLSRRSIS